MATILEWWQVEPYFRPTEFVGEGVSLKEATEGMKAYLLKPLFDLRCYLGIPITILSGYAKSGHSKKSKHYTGEAVDIWVKELFAMKQLFELYLEVERWNAWKGIGIYPNWKILKTGEPRPGLHLDVGWRPDVPPNRGARWGCWTQGEYVELNSEFFETLLAA